VSEAQDYPLGYSAQEAQRLADQGAQLEELTEDVLRRAGLRRGMQVLDIGSGAGDVSLFAARMVGSDGAVLGVDKASSSVEIARRRVAALSVIMYSSRKATRCIRDRQEIRCDRGSLRAALCTGPGYGIAKSDTTSKTRQDRGPSGTRYVPDF
jgi:cyclopropane fatty-acyl-phospholipid synthase-like methyltransferase